MPFYSLQDTLSHDNLSLFFQQITHANQLPTLLPPELLHTLFIQRPDWDIGKPEDLIQFYFAKDLAPLTQRTYTVAQGRYPKFLFGGSV